MTHTTFWQRLLGAFAFVGLLSLSTASPAAAANMFERLLMPGELAAAHAKFEEKCESCHKAFSKQAQDSLCLDCHKPVAADRQGGTGYHGKSVLAKNQPCSGCHTDHQGRDADIVGLDREVFDHSQTDFLLTGAHATQECGSCHPKDRKMREASSECFSCHRQDEPHKQRLGKQCGDCHDTVAWRDLKPFDHGKTKFRLAGAHADAACMSCHVGEVYAGLSTACWDCHKLSDVHDTQLGQDCAACHTEKAWKPATFDHDKTAFKLTDKHGTASCQDCHQPGEPLKISTQCNSCHAEDDVHRQKLGETCDDCHNARGWRVAVNFDHDLTDFPIVGLHAAVPCEACHATREYSGVSAECQACHANDDVHAGRFAQNCAQCHTAAGWSRWDFDHGRRTRFALTGKHAKVSCYGCHAATNVKTAALPTDCYSCHRKQDVHKGKFGTACERCHDTTTFGVAFIPKK